MRRRGVRRAEPIEDFENVLAAPEGDDPHTRSDIERVMLQLAPRQRDIVTAISLEGQSISATATRLSMSEVAVRVALHRALKALAVGLAERHTMKTADLINALAAEPPSPPLRLGRRVGLALVLGAAISAALFMTALGPRIDFN